MRELFLRLSDDSRERARYELKQSALADELKFLGMFFVGLRLHTFSLNHSCAAFLVVLLSGMGNVQWIDFRNSGLPRYVVEGREHQHELQVSLVPSRNAFVWK